MRLLALVLFLAACGESENAAPDLAVASDLATSPDLATDCPIDPDTGAPSSLRCTGLYQDFAARTVSPAALEYAPAFPLWSDGAEKTRWIMLPAGTQIDVSNLNEWQFPVGTKLWKEFRLSVAGTVRPVETRLYWKDTPGHWVRVSYAWSADLSTADQAPKGVVAVAGTNGYEVPSVAKCDMCHKGRQDRVLGFEAIGLAAPEATGLTWTQLQAKALVTSTNGNHLVDGALLQIPGVEVERKALGYFHSNCGVACHNPNVPSPYRQRLELDATTHGVGTVFQAPVFLGAVNQVSVFMPSVPVGTYRIHPTDPGHSIALYRMSLRDNPPLTQMPPVTSHVVDDAAVAQIIAWINYMTPANGYPAPAP